MSIWEKIKKFLKNLGRYLLMGALFLLFLYARVLIRQAVTPLILGIEKLVRSFILTFPEYFLGYTVLGISLWLLFKQSKGLSKRIFRVFSNILKTLTEYWIFTLAFFGLLDSPCQAEKDQEAKEPKRLVKPVTFDSIGGLYEAKSEMREIMKFLENKDRFAHLGATCPRGILLTGGPGTGKTLLVKALATESKYELLYGAADVFSSPFIGEGGRKVRKFFAKARSLAPCIVFLDEIDAIARRRNSQFSTSNESDNVFNVLLTEMDGFTDRGDIIVIGATNQEEIMDPAILRPGRFDRIIHIDLPSYKERVDIATVIMREYSMNEEVSPEKIAAMTSGMSGAYIRQVINGAALGAGMADKNSIDLGDVTESYYTIVGGGAARNFLELSEEDKKLTAYHEAGHALLAVITQHPDLLLVTVLPRGRSLGCTIMEGSQKDVVSLSYREAICQLQVLFGGYVAEEIAYGADNVTSGASGDLKEASYMANRMVKYYGWAQEYGFFVMDERTPFAYAETSKSEADHQVQALLKHAYEAAKEMISANMDIMHKLVDQLVLKDTLDKEEILSICRPISPADKDIDSVHNDQNDDRSEAVIKDLPIIK